MLPTLVFSSPLFLGKELSVLRKKSLVDDCDNILSAAIRVLECSERVMALLLQVVCGMYHVETAFKSIIPEALQRSSPSSKVRCLMRL